MISECLVPLFYSILTGLSRWSKAQAGMSIDPIHRDYSFCSHTVLQK